MAIGWMSVLKSVPWGEVIGSAPAIADGAQKLWGAVSKKTATAPAPAAAAADPESPPPALVERVAQLEAHTLALRQQMLESSALITRLADQNTQLIRRIELMRRRLMMVAVVAAVAVLGVVGSGVWTLMR